MRATVLCLAAVLLATSGLLVAVELTPQEAAGQRIFREGRSVSGAEIIARVGAANIPMSASALPCASCHGADGRGRPEGGVRPPAITWQRLSVPYGQQANGRRYPAYDQHSLIRVLTEGIDSGGNQLDPAMPRFAMSPDDMHDLIAYLRRLEDDHEPGVAPDYLRLGTLLPATGPQAELGRTIAAVLRAGLQQINDAGGIHGRQLQLLIADSGADAQSAVAALQQLSQDQVFALLAPLLPEPDAGFNVQLRASQLPVLGPLSAGVGAAGSALLFEVMPSVREQWLALGRYASTARQPGTALILHQENAAFSQLAGLLAEQLTAQGWQPVRQQIYPAQGPLVLGSATDALFFLGSEEQFATLGNALQQSLATPWLLAISSQVAGVALQMPEALSDRMFLAYPFIPSDWTEQGVAELTRIRRVAALDGQHMMFQIGALSAVQVLAEGLRRAGRDVSRVRLVKGLENLQGFRTGLTPVIGYGPGQRTGSSAAQIVRVDISGQRFQPVSAADARQ